MAFNLVSAEQIKAVNLDDPDLPEDGGSGMTIKVDTAANLTKENPILLKGQLGAESDTTYMKLGDGVTAWNDLEYIKANKSVQDAVGNVITDTYLKKAGDTATGDLTAPNFVGHLKGNADTATKATQDANGLSISANYFRQHPDNIPIGTSYDDITAQGVYARVDTGSDKKNKVGSLNQYTTSILIGNGWKHQLIFDTSGKICHRQAINDNNFRTIGQLAYTDSNVASATKLQTARNIALIGNATGSVSFDGSGDININATVNESKHAATADTATKATQDASGNVIEDTYATKAEVTVKGIKVDDATSPLVPDGSGVVTIPNADLSNYYTKTQVNAAITNAISAITDGDSKSY